MKALTVNFRDDQEELIAELMAESEEYSSKSEVVRSLIDRSQRLEEVERERDELRDQLAARNKREEEVTDLARYVQEEREWRTAPIWTRAKWWVIGKPQESG